MKNPYQNHVEISYNTVDLSDKKILVRAYDESNKIVIMIEQEDNVLFINCPNEKVFKELIFNLASELGSVCK
jgi:DNA recombination-dependent growth factor C